MPGDSTTHLPDADSAHGLAGRARPDGSALACGDCGHPLAREDNFCSACGQTTRLHPPTLREFVHEWLLHYVAIEGKLWKSMWALMARPGFLTMEYLAGRRQRYVQPLRLLLTLGVLFFLFLKLDFLPNIVSVEIQASAPAGVRPPALAPTAPATAPAPTAPESEDAHATPPRIELPEMLADLLPAKASTQIEAANARARADPQAELRRVGKVMLGMAPYAVLLSLPFFAGLLKLLFRPMAFGAHFVFALHLHAAWYGCLLLMGLGPWTWAVAIGWIWAHLYPVLALHRVHAIGWRHAFGKSVVLAALHMMVIIAGTIVLILLGVTLDP